MSDFLAHIGTPHEGNIPHSGRFPYGSGENPSSPKYDGLIVKNPYGDFVSTVAALRKKYGNNDEAVCRELYYLGWEKVQSRKTPRREGESDDEYKIRSNMMSTGDLRARLSAAKTEEKLANINAIERMRAHGDTDTEIAKKLGLAGESSVRAYMKESVIEKNKYIESTTNEIISKMNEYGYIDVGKGISNRLGISDTQLRACVTSAIDKEGYKLYYFEVPQVNNPAQKTSMKVLVKDDIPWKEVNANLGEIYNFAETGARTDDQGRSWQNMRYPTSISSDRVAIRYADQGGLAMDGVIQIRPGVADLSLGESRYAQVRIAVDDKLYLKGMAMYADDIPKGKDIVFNTNKESGTPFEKVLKPFETKMEKGKEVIDRDNPFGAAIKKDVGQREYIDPKTGESKLSAINIVREEGDWTKWTKTISAQMLSKQNPSLAKRQLDLTYNDNLTEFENIKQITNPTVKKKLLMDFADECDTQASTLVAKGFPNQSWHTLLPLPNIKDNECYCKNFETGTDVVLIRYPHGGKFEIPSLTVNNNDRSGKKILGNARDAIGISPAAASQLSGADFDGDTAMVIPNPWIDKKTGHISKTPTGTKLIDTDSAIKDLKTFDPHKQYAGYPGMKVIKEQTKQTEMGVATNLLTDMGVQGAKPDEIARAVKYTMVVIDAKKHKLDYKRARKELQINELKKKYQAHIEDDGKIHYGASSIISRSDSEIKVKKRQFTGIDPNTGEKQYRYTNDTYISKTGKVQYSTQASTKMKETKDAFTLVYRDLEGNTTQMESVYATHANKMKALANEARKEYTRTPNLTYNPSAYKQYEGVVKQMKAELSLAESNSPSERKAQALANQWTKDYKKENPGLTKAEYKKKSALALTEARSRVGAKRHQIEMTDEKFNAIQAGAVHDSTLQKILNHTDMDVVRQKAMPSQRSKLTASQVRRIKALLNSGYDLSYADIAKDMNVSVSTIQNVVSEM